VTLAIGASEFSLVLLLTVVVVVPVALFAFVKGGKGLEDLGKGRFAIDRDDDLGSGMTGADSATGRESEAAEEVRQMLEAADFRRQSRGEGRLDVEAEIERLMSEQTEEPVAAEGQSGGGDPGVRDEIRQLVVANNERRERRGEPPLDVEPEVERRMKEWS
jgi:hypothetical protein